MVFADRKNRCVTSGIAADDDRDLRFEREHLFEHAVDAVEGFPSSFGFSFAVHSSLSLSVIAEAGCLEDAGEEVIRERLNVFNALNRLVRRGRHACTLNEGLLDIAVLCGRNSVCMRRRRETEGSERCKALGRYILEFCRHSLSALSERLEALRIVVAAGDLLQRHFTRRRIFARFEHGNVVAHTGSGLREHAAELTAAQKAERGAGEKRFHFTHRSASGEFVDRERHGAGFCILRDTKIGETARQFGIVERQNLHSVKRSIGGACFADSESSDRNALRHLYDRMEAVDTAEIF